MDFDSITLPAHANPIVIQWLKEKKAIINIWSDCWEWEKARCKSGYGRASFNGKTVSAHRLSINCHDNKMSLHKCRNRKCVNPSHLYSGTHKDNMTDRIADSVKALKNCHEYEKSTKK